MPRHAFQKLTLLFVTVLLVGAVACKKKPPVVPAPAPPPPPPQPPPPPPPVPAPPQDTPEIIFARMTLAELNAQKPLEDVFFELDKAELSDAGRASLAKSSQWMKTWQTTRVTIEGHADSRGTNEYNLALGDRRAAAVRDYLVTLGIASSRIAVVSKGEEQPFCTDESESCWAQNRRGHFIITAK